LEATLKYFCPQTGAKFLQRTTCDLRMVHATRHPGRSTVPLQAINYERCLDCNGPVGITESCTCIPPKRAIIIANRVGKEDPFRMLELCHRVVTEKLECKPTTPPAIAELPKPKPRKPRPSRRKTPDTFNLHLLRKGANRIFPADMWQQIRNAVMYLNAYSTMVFKYRKLADGIRVTRLTKWSTQLPANLRRRIIECRTCGRKFKGINAVSCPECRRKDRRENL
jgi:hypothetical protein